MFIEVTEKWTLTKRVINTNHIVEFHAHGDKGCWIALAESSPRVLEVTDSYDDLKLGLPGSP